MVKAQVPQLPQEMQRSFVWVSCGLSKGVVRPILGLYKGATKGELLIQVSRFCFTYQTWDIVSCPPSIKPLGSKFVFSIKFRLDGSIDRYKAQLIVLGNKQEYELDYDETFAPIAKMTTVHTLLALVASQSWPLHQMNVKNAFLHGDLKEEQIQFTMNKRNTLKLTVTRSEKHMIIESSTYHITGGKGCHTRGPRNPKFVRLGSLKGESSKWYLLVIMVVLYSR
ncbi:hypothetical protein CR513_32881, partial [Mucuna pruriens]